MRRTGGCSLPAKEPTARNPWTPHRPQPPPKQLAARCQRPPARCGTAGHPTGLPAPAHQAQRSLHFPDRSVFERKQAHRHALEQVDIKGTHNIEPTLGLVARTHHHEQIAHTVDAHDGVARRHGPQDGGHLAGTDVLQGNDHRSIAGRERVFSGLADVAGNRFEVFGLAHVVHTTRIARHGQAVGLQGALQQGQRVVGRDRATGGQGHAAREWLVQHIVHLQHFAHKDVNHIHDGGIFKLIGALRTLDLRHCRGCVVDAVIPTDDPRLLLTGCRSGRCCCSSSIRWPSRLGLQDSRGCQSTAQQNRWLQYIHCVHGLIGCAPALARSSLRRLRRSRWACCIS